MTTSSRGADSMYTNPPVALRATSTNRGHEVNLDETEQVAERIWLVTFMQYDLRYFDDETC